MPKYFPKHLFVSKCSDSLGVQWQKTDFEVFSSDFWILKCVITKYFFFLQIDVANRNHYNYFIYLKTFSFQYLLNSQKLCKVGKGW